MSALHMSVAVKSGFEDYLVSVGALPAGSNGAGGRRSNGYRALMERAGFEPAAFAETVAKFHALPRTSLEAMRAGRPTLDRFSTRFLRESAVFPYETDDGEIHLATADPSDTAILQTMELTLGRSCVREIATFDEIEMLLRDVAGTETVSITGEDDISDLANRGDDDDLDSLRDMASGAPVVRTVNELFERAVEYRATDIHIEPFRGTLQVRLRVDGLLRTMPPPSPDMARAIVSRVKILAGLNIAERRLPQDGRARVRVGNLDLDLRVATMPTAHGEAAILRVLERNQRLLDFVRLGFGARDRAVLERHLEAPHGLIIVTGPTGSGKTTTLASALARLNSPIRKILTIEDPIEYEIQGVNQTQVKPAIGLTFASALRSFLRQDPDVIMVGEMRDGETAKIGIQASLTGHLVLTTLHTNTAAASITRMIDMGVEPFLIASTLRCILAQRLVRVLCPDCRRMAPVTEATIARDPRFAAIGFHAGELVGEAVGCDRCGNTGYRGRLGVFEILEVNERISRLIGTGTDDVSMEREARADGMTTMIEDGVAKCRSGLTSVDEILRVTASR
ncbi:MAG: GspE/PulE family protein [Pseudolabrys sp.]